MKIEDISKEDYEDLKHEFEEKLWQEYLNKKKL